VSQGRGEDLLRTYVILSLVIISACVVGLAWGPLGVILTLAAVGLLVRLPILYHLAGRSGPVRTADLWRGFLAHVPSWAAVCAATALARSVVGDAAPLGQVVVGGSVGLAVGAAVTLALKRPREGARYAWRMVRTSLAR
jgi:PST family polysaccharide transporter